MRYRVVGSYASGEDAPAVEDYATTASQQNRGVYRLDVR